MAIAGGAWPANTAGASGGIQPYFDLAGHVDFGFPVVAGYCAKLFPVSSGQRRRTPMGYGWPSLSSLSQAPASQLMNRLWRPSPRYSRRYSPSGLSGFFHRQAGNPEVVRCLQTLPAVRPPCLCLALRRPSLEFRTCAPSVLVASRHAFAVGFLATLIFSIRPQILPSFLNSRELWSARLMGASLMLITAGCTLRVLAEPLAYSGIRAAAWKVIPLSAFAELAAVLLFAFNLAMRLATPIPSWFGRRHLNDRMSIYWLVSSYPATGRLLVEHGLVTLAAVAEVPKTLTLREAAQADGASTMALSWAWACSIVIRGLSRATASRPLWSSRIQSACRTTASLMGTNTCAGR